MIFLKNRAPEPPVGWEPAGSAQQKLRISYIFGRSEVWEILLFESFFKMFKGLQPLFPARIDAKSAKKSKSLFSVFRVIPIAEGGVILENIVIFCVKIDSFSSKSLHQQRPVGLLPSFCC